jgi:hypothetical protein
VQNILVTAKIPAEVITKWEKLLPAKLEITETVS